MKDMIIYPVVEKILDGWDVGGLERCACPRDPRWSLAARRQHPHLDRSATGFQHAALSGDAQWRQQTVAWRESFRNNRVNK